MSNVTSSSLTNLSSKKIVESQKQRQAELKKRKAELEKDLADNAAYLQSKEYLEIEVQYNSIENSIQQTLEEKKRILGKEFNETKERTCLETYFYGDTGAYEKMQNLEQQMVNHILATNGNRVHKLKTTGFLDIEGGDKIQTHLTKAEKDQLRPLAQSDITEITPVERTYQGEQYHIITCKIRGEQYTAIQVPSKLKTKSYRDTHVGRALVEHKGTNWYPAFLSVKRLANPLDQDRLIRKTEPAMQADGTPHTNISLYTDGNQE
jgi:hypothetical protein